MIRGRRSPGIGHRVPGTGYRIAALFLLLFLHGAAAIAQPGPVQLGVRISPDTVTVGQHFVVVVRVRAPRGATIAFPTGTDSATAHPLTATRVAVRSAIVTTPDTSAVMQSAAYRLTAWDTGPQPLSLGDVVVRAGGQTGYVSLADRSVFVRSVLPADTALHVPKPPRPRIAIVPFNWIPWLALLAALVAASLLWWAWRWFSRRRRAPLDPWSAAERDFERIEAMQLVEGGEGERHVAMMTDVMRTYLAARVSGIERSHTSSELLAAASEIHRAAPDLGELLWNADLVKFARRRVDGDEAASLGRSAREIARTVESFVAAREQPESGRKAA